MLTHIVCWKYKEGTTQEQHDNHVAKLKSLEAIINEIISLKAGADILHLDRSYDTALVITFANREALDVYTVHPAHQEVVAIGREIAANVMSVDFID